MLITLTEAYWNEKVLLQNPDTDRFLDRIEDVLGPDWCMVWMDPVAYGDACTDCGVPFVEGEYALVWLVRPVVPPTPTICLDCSVARFVPDLPVPDFLISKEAVSDGDSRTVD